MHKTIIIKLSGEALGGAKGYGLDFPYIKKICQRIVNAKSMGIKIGIVCGGGNFLRGRDTKEMEREMADYAGMMATVMNALALRDIFQKLGVEVELQSALEVGILNGINPTLAKIALDNGKILIFAGGCGKPFYSTDSGAAQRAKDINADMIIKLTNVDGIYDKDPNKYQDARKYDFVTFKEALDKKLGIMDYEALEICEQENIEIIVLNINNENGLIDVLNGKIIGTHVKITKKMKKGVD